MSTVVNISNETFPQCPHLHKFDYERRHNFLAGKVNLCSWCSDRLAKEFEVAPLFCKNVCKQQGPYCGKTISPEEEQKFLAKAFFYKFIILGATNLNFIKKILKSYMKEMDVQIPSVWPDIKKATEHLHKFPFFTGVRLTGSIVSKKDTYKDYDIVLCVTDIVKAHEEKFLDNLPEFINGVRCDYFITNSPENVLFFICLDCDKKILYTTKWFELKLKSISPDITVIKCETKGMHEMIIKEIDKYQSESMDL